MPFLGATTTIRGTLTAPITGVPQDAPEGTLKLLIVDPTGEEKTIEQKDVSHDGVGLYSYALMADPSGLWHYRWLVSGETADEGDFEVESVFDKRPVDLTDLRVLVPAARRACEGPYGPPTGKPVLRDNQVYQMVADACADVILFTGKLFGHELKVKARDPLVGFPTEWQTDTVLSVWEGAVIVNQTALDFYFHLFRDLKMSETIQNEGTQWTYELSAGVVKAYLELLKENRDKALEGLQLHHPILDRFASNIRVRDQATVAVLEWWDVNSPGFSGSGLPGGQEASVIPWFPGGEW